MTRAYFEKRLSEIRQELEEAKRNLAIARNAYQTVATREYALIAQWTDQEVMAGRR